MKTHELKIWPEPFDAVRNGTKTFDVRRDDRGFRVGDALALQEFNPGTGAYTGREIKRVVGYVGGRGGDAESVGIKEGYCVLGLAK